MRQLRVSEADRLLQQAERGKARILEVPGKIDDNQVADQFLAKVTSELMHSVVVDEEFSMVASHVSDGTKRKIVNGEYVDFVKLLPREDFNVETTEEDISRYGMINKGGQAFWANENEIGIARRGNGLAITSIHKWEEAFRIFSHVYTTAHPNRASELSIAS